MLTQTKYPPIDPVPVGVHRPMWSVMIPTYNCAHYLERTLRSVLAQDPGPEDMQIEVVDDCSTKDDPEAVVKDIAGSRVVFFRQPRNLGSSANFTSCVQRAKGHWVHILHGDDMVLPGFYHRLREAFECEPTIGAAFCRHIYVEEDDHWLFLSPLEQKTPGLLSHWLERIAVDCLLQPPSIVVKRRVYEALGGFYPGLSAGEDWEMWKRIAVHYPVWYEPQPLACYREHSSSLGAHTRRSGAFIADTRKSIEISRSYLPNTVADELSRKAREHWALCALGLARGMLVRRDLAAATVLIREALKCSHSFRVTRSVIALGLWSMCGGTRLLYKTAVGRRHPAMADGLPRNRRLRLLRLWRNSATDSRGGESHDGSIVREMVGHHDPRGS